MIVKNNHPSYLGDSAEVLLMAELVSRGLNVSIPFGANQLYDLVVENGKTGKLLKVQVKMRSSFHNGTKYFRFQKIGKYKGQVDVMAFLCGEDWVFVRGNKITEDFFIDVKKFRANCFRIFGA